MTRSPPSTLQPRLAPTARAVLLLRGAMLLAVLAALLMLLYVGITTRQTALRDGRARMVRIVQIAQEQALRIVETNEVISRSVSAAVQGRGNAELRARAPDLHALLRELTTNLRQLQSVWIWDENGRPIATNIVEQPPAGLDVSDRAYFAWARAHPGGGWYVSRPLRSRTTGQLFFDFVQGRTLPGGSFGGAISVSLRPEYFAAFFRNLLVREPAYTLALYLADGYAVARYPELAGDFRLPAGSELAGAMRSGAPVGEISGPNSIDGVWRYGAYRRVGDLPLYVAAGAEQDVLLAPWRRSMLLLAAGTVPLTAVLVGLCWFALRRVHREHAIALALEEQYEQRLRTEEALRHAQKMEALGRLTGGVAHDFNNVLMVVQTNVALARKLEERGRSVAQALPPIERAVANGAQLTRQLLAIARRQPLQVRSVRMQEALPEVARLMGSTLGSRTRVQCEVAPDTPPVTVDQAELELALINLCINARDAMPEGGHVTIEARLAAPPAGAAPSTPWVRVDVVDTGEGIPPEMLARVAEPFFTTKPLGKGTGLGLSQVHSFVQQSGGRMEIASEIGRGTTVRLLLPSSTLVEQEAPRAAAPLQSLAARVLLVEDNEDIAASVAVLLEQAGARVVRYATAEDALAALRSGAVEPQIVLSDIQLAGALTGVDLAHALAAEGRRLPIVLMTGYTDRLQEAVAQGYRVLPKPTPPDRLLQALAEALAGTQPLPA